MEEPEASDSVASVQRLASRVIAIAEWRFVPKALLWGIPPALAELPADLPPLAQSGESGIDRPPIDAEMDQAPSPFS